MKNNRLPSKKEWDQIIDDAFSSEDIHQFSESYLRRKARLQKGIIMNEDRRRIKETPNNSGPVVQMADPSLLSVATGPSPDQSENSLHPIHSNFSQGRIRPKAS